jgi:uncharacterized protein (DUF58 family)
MTAFQRLSQVWQWIPSGQLVSLFVAVGLLTSLGAFAMPSFQQWAIPTALAVDVLLLLLAAIDGLRVSAARIQVRREALGKLSIGRDNPVNLQVGSLLLRPGTYQYQIRDFAPAELPGNPVTISGTLNANSKNNHSYIVHPLARGAYQWQGIHVRQLGPWGLAWQQWRVDAAQSVVVYPDLMGLRLLSIKLALQSTGALRQARRQGAGTEFAELREYTVGDDPRFIDWKATARRNRPLVKVLEPEQEQTVIILLDRGRLMTANIQGIQRFDWGLNAALSLAMAATQRGDKVGMGLFDRLLHTWIPPQRGQTHFSQMLERLSGIQPELLEPDYVGAVNTVISRQSRRALVVIITDIVDEIASTDLLQAMTRLTPRYLPFCVTLRDPQVDRLASHLADKVPDAYNQAVAIDLLQQRRLAFAKLKQRGVLVLDAPATQISDQLVEQYLMIKLKSRL